MGLWVAAIARARAPGAAASSPLPECDWAEFSHACALLRSLGNVLASSGPHTHTPHNASQATCSPIGREVLKPFKSVRDEGEKTHVGGGGGTVPDLCKINMRLSTVLCCSQNSYCAWLMPGTIHYSTHASASVDCKASQTARISGSQSKLLPFYPSPMFLTGQCVLLSISVKFIQNIH